jgi:hypothetical protein
MNSYKNREEIKEFLTQVVNFATDDVWCILQSTKNPEEGIVTTLDEIRVNFNDYNIRIGQMFIKDGYKYIVIKIGE